MAMHKQENDKVHSVVTLSGFKHTMGGFTISRDHVVQVEMPEHFTTEDIQRFRIDAERLAARLRESPEEMKAFLDTAIQGDIRQAQQIAQKLKLTEEDFSAQGGGLIGLIIVGIILLIVLAGEAR